MVFIDIPVDLGDVLGVGGHVGRGARDRIAPVDGLAGISAVLLEAGKNLRLQRGAETGIATSADAFEIFKIDEEKQLVANDRAAEGGSEGAALKLGDKFESRVG